MGGERRFDSILVANRGEIACRVLKTARELGYRTIAVHSEADGGAPHVALADEAVLLGPAPAAESYLAIDRILDAAERAAAGAIHPGYGFLSENAGFARACEAAGIVFIGPPAAAIELMGNKAAAKRRMAEAGVPCVPGCQGEAQDDASLALAADGIGYPVMVKAAAGGGGRGMRLVHDARELEPALSLARAEAESAFGSAELILEKAIPRPRHVEFQVMADAHGTVIHLGERDCSIQRRHQKVIEESPCPVMNPDLRRRMGAAAVEAARSIGYRGAGTVEFLLDEDGDFHFLEMNTRLQVEHPVTEMVTGQDLVALQIGIARGERLALRQEEIELNGHAIEARLYAEDPERDFLPDTGRVILWRPPAGEGIRVDSGIETGQEVSPFYDAMVAKIIAWGPSRSTARLRLIRALEETALFGVRCNRDFLIRLLAREAFAAGEATTAFIEESAPESAEADDTVAFHRRVVAAVLEYRSGARRASERAVRSSGALMNWGSGGRLTSWFRYAAGTADERLAVSATAAGYEAANGEAACTVTVGDDDGLEADIALDGAEHRVVYCHPEPGVTWLTLDGASGMLADSLSSREVREESGGGRVAAPMHGQIRDIDVAEGDAVSKGQRLFVLEAMKMQQEVLAAVDGRVTRLDCSPGDQVGAGDLIVLIETNKESTGAT